jgi:hypothetical protein
MCHRLRALWRNLTHKQIVEDDLTQELHSYQTMLADEKSRAGINPTAALRDARLEMEGMEQIKETFVTFASASPSRHSSQNCANRCAA